MAELTIDQQKAIALANARLRTQQEVAPAVQKRAAMNPIARGVDTAVRGLARAFPFMDDAAALGDTLIGHGDGDTFGARYKSNLAAERQVNQMDDTQRPVLSYGGQVAGAVALPAGAAARATSVGGKALAGGLVGAGYGAASGFGAGDSLEDRTDKAIMGGAAGGVLGAAAAPVVAGGAYLAKPIVNAVRGSANPEREASRRVFDLIAKATREGRGLSEEELAMARKADSPLVLGDMAGEPGRAMARSAANTSPEGREALEQVTQDRFAGQSERTSNFIQTLVGGKFDPADFTKWLQTRAKLVNAPLYKKATAEAEMAAASMPDGLWTPELANLAKSPTFAAAMRDSIPRGADRAVAAGNVPTSRSPFVFADEGVSLATAGKDGTRALPSLEFWDNVKRELDAKIFSLRKEGDKAGADAAATMRTKLLKELDAVAPSYKQARASAASFFKAEDALEAGQNFVGMTWSADLVGARQALAKMNATERALFAQGYAAELAAQVSRIADNANVPARSIFNTPLARQKMDAAIGPQRAKELQTFLQVESVMNRLRTALGNSTTARQIIERGMAGGIGGAALGAFSGNGTEGATVGIAAGIVSALSGKVDRRVAKRVGELLASSDPPKLLEAAQIIAANRGAREAIDSLDIMLAKIGGTLAGGNATADAR